MNAPFPPSGGTSPSGDEPELRSLLEAEARRQPPVSSDLRAGVDRRVRRHRTRLAAGLAPVVVLVLVGAFLLAPRSSSETTLATASEPTAESVDGTAPATDTTVAGTDTTIAAQTDCGSVEIGPDRIDPETAPLDCFIEAFNAGGDARLVVLMAGPDGGQLTETVTTAPGKQVHVAVDGSLSIKIPALGLGAGGGGVVAPEPDGAGTDCGTVTISEGASPEQMSPSSDMMRCLIGLFTSGETGGFSMVVNDATGGSLTMAVDLAADKTLTVTIDGELTQTLPAELTVPSDLTSHLPPNGFGMDELGLGGGGSMFPGGTTGN